MKVAISQPRYLPALNYIQRIAIVDIFVLLDDVQHSREFENRNRIKTPNGPIWLTIPCKGKRHRKNINELRISGWGWIDKHKRTIYLNYKKAKFFSEDFLEYLYDINKTSDSLTDILEEHLKKICEYFNIKTKIIRSSELEVKEKGEKKLYLICKRLGATTYISGPMGRNYIKDKWENIEVLYHDFEYPQHKQLWGDFIPWMAFIDPLFNEGKNFVKEIIHATPKLSPK